MTIIFDGNSVLQNDQTEGTQTTDGDTDVDYSDTRLAALIAAVGTSGYSADTDFAEAVSGAYSADVMTVSGSEAVSGLKFVDPDGGALDGDDSGLETVDGYSIKLYSNADGTIVYGAYNDGTDDHLAFAVQMTVTMVDGVATVGLATLSYAPITSPDATDDDEPVSLGDYLFISAQDSTGFSFDSLASTKFLYGVVGSTAGGFLVIGKDPKLAADGTPASGGQAGDTINSSQGGGSVTIGVNNQQFTGDTNTATAEEGAYFTYIKGMAAGTYQDADQLLPTDYISVSTAKLQISQVQGNGVQGMRLTALDYDGSTDGRDFVSDLTTPDQGDIVAFESIHIYNVDGTDTTVTMTELLAGTVTTNGRVVTKDGFTFTLRADGSVDILGLGSKDWIEWTTDGLHDRILVEVLSGKWDIGGFQIEELSSSITSIGDHIQFGDDAPTVDLVLDGTAELVLDESTGTDADDGNADDGAPLAQQSIAAADYLSSITTSFGTDGPNADADVENDVWSLSTIEEQDSGLVASNSGLHVFLFLEDGVIVGREGADATAAKTGDEVLSFAIDPDTGEITVTQSLALAHADETDGDDALGLTGAGLIVVTRTLTDGDGDSGYDTADLTGVFVFEDDGPTFTKPDDLLVDFTGSGTVGSASAPLEFDTGNDGYGGVRITDYDATLQVNGKTLTGVLNEAATLLTYYFDANNNGLRDAGEDAFSYELKDLLGSDGLEGTDGVLDTSVFTVLNVPPAETLDYDFRDLPAGQNGFGILSGRAAGATAPDPDATSILIVGNKSVYNADHTFSNTSATVNTSKGGGPTTIGVSNQMIDPKEAVWFSYLTDPDNSFVSGVTNGLNQSEADDFDNILFRDNELTEVNEAFFKVVQVQGNPKYASLEINAYDLDEEHKDLQGVKMVDELNRLGLASVTAGDEPEQVTITSVTVGLETYYRDDDDVAGVIDWQDDGGVQLLKVSAGDTIVFETLEGHDAALITGVSGKFDIGDYGVFQGYDTPDLSLDVELTVTDGDGDTAIQMQNILVDGTGSYDDNILT